MFSQIINITYVSRLMLGWFKLSLAITAICFAFGNSAKAQDWKEIPFYYQGKEYYLSQMEGKTKLVMFWATWCPACRERIPIISGLKNQFKGRKDVVILPISIDDEGEEIVSQYYKYAKINNLHAATDKDSNLFHSFGFHLLPSMVLISKDNKILEIYGGLKNFDVKYIEKVLRGD